MDFDFSELSPVPIAFGLIGGAFAFGIMGNTGDVQVGLFWRILSFAATGIACFFIAHFIFNKD